MRMWITTIEETPGNGPRPDQNPAGLDIESAWAQWPIVDADDDVPVTNPQGVPFVVCLARDLDVAPSAGRDFGDPTTAAFHTDPLPANATDTIEDHVGLERGELAGSTRAEALRAITQDENRPIGCTWGPDKIGARVWLQATRRVRRFRRRADREWFDGLTLNQRNFIRALDDEQKDTLRDTPIPGRVALLQSWA